MEFRSGTLILFTIWSWPTSTQSH